VAVTAGHRRTNKPITCSVPLARGFRYRPELRTLLSYCSSSQPLSRFLRLSLPSPGHSSLSLWHLPPQLVQATIIMMSDVSEGLTNVRGNLFERVPLEKMKTKSFALFCGHIR
jgi:hypothetical protein